MPYSLPLGKRYCQHEHRTNEIDGCGFAWLPCGGAEPLPILEAWGHIADESDPSSQLEEGIEQTSLRKLPLCQVIVKNPLGQLWLVGKNVLQGPRNGR